MASDGEWLVPPGTTMSIAEATALLTQPGMPLEVEEAIVRGEKLKVWKNAPPSVRMLMMTCHLFSDRDFLVYESTRYTFGNFYSRTINMGHALAKAGVKKGDRVGILMRNFPEWAVAFLATMTIGAIAVPINAWLKPAETEYCIRDSAPKVIFVDDQRLATVGQYWAPLQKDGTATTIVLVRSPAPKKAPGGLVLYDAFEKSAGTNEDMLEVDIEPDDPATILYTSGTTGRPKGALGTHRNYISQLLGTKCVFDVGKIRSSEGLPNQPALSVLLAVPLFHATGCLAILASALAGGAKIVMMKKWEPEEAMKLIQNEKITSMGGVPTLIWQLLEHPNASKYDLSSIIGFFSGGAPAAPELLTLIEKKFPKRPSRNGYGLTETSAGIVGVYGYDYARKPDSVGIPLFNSEVMIVEPGTTNPLPVGQIGEVALKGPLVVAGYWKNPEATAKSFKKGGWFLSGDLGRVDDEGFLYILDRAKDMLIRGGENIYCVEVENCLFAHPAVLDCAVVGVPDKVLGEHVAAVVRLKPNVKRGSVSMRDIQEFCKPHIAYFKIPIYIEFWDKELPRNAAGKVLKNALREDVVKGYKAWVAKGGKAKL
ncbi:long-chain-fatty-acid--CoA ligase [Zopfochytrium polystomum]|nr:long-chain-fatty-acid--CoA ligase [Zopfochytrium polystomum]